MRNVIKKISMCFLIIALGWVPVQSAFAASSMLHSSNDMIKALTQQISVNTESQKRNPGLGATNHCDMAMADDVQQDKMNCCTQSGMCDQFGHNCNHCVSFIAITQNTQLKLFIPRYTIQHIYNSILIGMTSLTTYRPPR